MSKCHWTSFSFPFLSKMSFLSPWKPSVSATSIFGRSHWSFLLGGLLLSAGNVRHDHLIGPGTLRVCSVFLLKVRCLVIFQDKGEDAKLMVKLKVRMVFKPPQLRRWHPTLSLRKLRERISPQVECGNYQYYTSWANLSKHDLEKKMKALGWIGALIKGIGILMLSLCMLE